MEKAPQGLSRSLLYCITGKNIQNWRGGDDGTPIGVVPGTIGLETWAPAVPRGRRVHCTGQSVRGHQARHTWRRIGPQSAGQACTQGCAGFGDLGGMTRSRLKLTLIKGRCGYDVVVNQSTPHHPLQ